MVDNMCALPKSYLSSGAQRRMGNYKRKIDKCGKCIWGEVVSLVRHEDGHREREEIVLMDEDR
ncbi:hypothetical protein BPOR_0236g00030 [Botrytis porri]|uniref:Uncharacterized protein n=1 Tax=Botrytis porri TaxID=87229 RepID=A0A4Z1KP54_9HELO|nr:hypothetical protein BPOR_0236g00030 [Botrytis porri]